MGFTAEQVEVLLQIARDASQGGTFEERMGAVCESLSVLVPSTSLSLVVADPTQPAAPPQRVYMRNADLEAGRAYAAHYMQHDPLLGVATETPGAAASLGRAVSPGRWGRDPYTGEFLPRFGLRHIFGVLEPMPDRATMLLAVHRERGMPDMSSQESELLRLAGPDIARAAAGAMLEERLARRAAGGEASGSALILLDEAGEVLHADEAAARLCEQDGLSTLLSEARRLTAPTAHEGATVVRMWRTAAGSVVRARCTRLGRNAGAAVAAVLELLAPGTEERFEAVTEQAGLTPRERQIAALVCEGLGNRGIAHRLGCSPATVGVHLTRVYRKTSVTNRTELTRVLSGGEAVRPARA